MGLINKLSSLFSKPVDVNPPTSIASTLAPIMNYYEATEYNANRKFIFNSLTSADLDIATARKDVMSKSRYLMNNSPLLSGIVDRFVTYTISSGLYPIPSSSDPVYNQLALSAFNKWSKKADVNGKDDWVTIQEIIYRSILVDGDIFVFLTGETGTDGVNRPRIQLVESHLVDSGKFDNDTNYIDGVKLDGSGKVISYQVTTFENGKEVKKEYKPDELLQFMYATRANQHRGIGILASVINTAIDLDDILALEKAAVKEVSGHTDIIKTATGEAADADQLLKRKFDVTKVNHGSSTTLNSTVSQWEYYRKAFGPSAKVLKAGDEWSGYKPERPSPAWEGFVDFICNVIAIAVGVSPSVLLGTKMGGADSRRDIEATQRLFERHQRALAVQFSKIYEYVIDAEYQNGFIKSRPSDWNAVEWQYPKKISADLGRESQQDRADVAAGLLTLSEYCGRYGIDYHVHLQQLGNERTDVKAVEEEFGLKTGEIADKLYAVNGQVIPSAPVTTNNQPTT